MSLATTDEVLTAGKALIEHIEREHAQHTYQPLCEECKRLAAEFMAICERR